MKSVKEIAEEVRPLTSPNKGIVALAQQADIDSSFCIMDLEYSSEITFRCECVDRNNCSNADFMLACVQTRSFIPGVRIKQNATTIYIDAMRNK